MTLARRTFLQLAAGAAALPIASTARAQDFPTRTITIIVPFAPGGGTDIAARIVGEHMARTLGQQIIIENVVGAGGATGSARAMRAPPDGHTILMGQMGTHAAAVALNPNLPYRPDVDFAPIGLVVDQAVVIVGRKGLPANDLTEFTAYLKANADKLNMAHAGVGSITHFTCLLLNSLAGVKTTMVPFNGAGPAMTAVVAGQVDYMCDVIPAVVQQVQAGTIKAFAIGTPGRNPALPNVPTSREAGLPGFQAAAWFALFAPQAVPKPILDKLTDALDKALDDERVRRRLIELGCDIPGKERRGQQALANLVTSEIARWTPIIKGAS
jgi:tripartite-type tricarboxylate transporter receptor subunit TctC